MCLASLNSYIFLNNELYWRNKYNNDTLHLKYKRNAPDNSKVKPIQPKYYGIYCCMMIGECCINCFSNISEYNPIFKINLCCKCKCIYNTYDVIEQQNIQQYNICMYESTKKMCFL